MGIRFKETSESASAATISPSLREMLLFTTMSIIGLTVEVHIKDGSVFSGIFHTASVDKGYGVVLKKARMIKKGTHASNGVNRSLIDTLVVLPENLVQVLAKSVMISADGVCGGAICDHVGAVTSDVKSYGGSGKETTTDNSQLVEQTKISVRQDGVHMPKEDVRNDKPESGYQKEELVHEVKASTTNLEECNLQVKSRKENNKVTTKLLPNGIPRKIASQNTPDSLRQPQAASNADTAVVSKMSNNDCFSSPTATPVIPVQTSVANRSSKESKLNPGAKIFSPANVRSVASPPVLTAGANVAYVPSNYFPAMPHIAPQPEVGMRSFPPCPSLPLKLVSYGNMATANGGSVLQYSQPIAGPVPNRPQPVRYNNQYQSIQPGPAYVQPVPQNGLMGRTGQVLYLNPATHEMVPGPPTFSHAPHPQLTTHSVHFPKHEVSGIIAAQHPQLSFAPPLMAHEQLPFAIPSPIPLPQPAFPTIRPVSILGANVHYGAKFL